MSEAKKQTISVSSGTVVGIDMVTRITPLSPQTFVVRSIIASPIEHAAVEQTSAPGRIALNELLSGRPTEIRSSISSSTATQSDRP